MTTDPTKPALLLDVTGVAALLTCSARHVWRMCEDGRFPAPISIGVKLKRWPRSVVEAWVTQQTERPAKETQ